MRIAFVYSPGRCARLAGLAAGEVPSDFFYGAAELAAAGHQVTHFEFDDRSLPRGLPSVLDLLRRLKVAPPKTDGWTLLHAWQASPPLNEFDVVVATVGNLGFALACSALLGRLRVPLVTIQCGLLHHRYSPWQKALTRSLLGRMKSLFFGEAELAPTLAAFSLPADRMSAGQFGVDLNFWSPAPSTPREDFVLAIGNDTRRDYPTLLAAAARINAPVRIITRLAMPDVLPANVSVLRGSWHERAFSDDEIRELFRRAACVVTPLHDTLQPSGQSVTLQAMACGTPVVLTRTAGLWNREVIVDDQNVRLVPPADPEALAMAVGALLSDSALAARLGAAGRQSVLSHGDIGIFARQIGELCQRAIR